LKGWARSLLRPSQILYEDNHLLIVDKPADWIVQGAQSGQQSLLESAKEYIRTEYHKPGAVYLGVVSRLDGPVTGVVPFARTSKAAARLSEQFRDRKPSKVYLAMVEGIPQSQSGKLEHTLIRKPEATKTRLALDTDHDALQAILNYRTLRSHEGKSLLEIVLVTGRKHQIRCQLTAMGWPIVGDKLYGAQESFPHGIALHCSRLNLEHPTTKKSIDVSATLPLYWPAWAHFTQ
jgi:23S rRNA pseudouridine1911/1915/1917 synthase